MTIRLIELNTREKWQVETLPHFDQACAQEIFKQR
jgi:hypothetical protein